MSKIKGDLTTKDVMDRFQAMEGQYASLVKDVHTVMGNLSDTKNELTKARELYEKTFLYCLKKAIMAHPKCALTYLFIILVVIVLAIAWLASKNDVSIDANAKTFQSKPIS